MASNKGSENKFRGYKSTTAEGNPAGYPYQFTLYKLTQDSGEEAAVAAPAADPQAGEVEAGTQITLSSSTVGAQIYYTLDGSDPSDANNAVRQQYNDSNKPVIQEACALKAVAVLDGVCSAVQTLSYTIKTDVPQPVPTVPFADGDQIVIYAPAYNVALSSEKTGQYYNVGTPVTITDGKVEGYGAADIWTVKDNGDGTYSF